MISDAQLWSASFLAQAVRGLLPIGQIWNPILEELVAMIAILQNESLRKVAFYVQTSNFVDWLKANTKYTQLRVTGHSLGVSERNQSCLVLCTCKFFSHIQFFAYSLP